MRLIWDKGDAREKKIAEGELKRSIAEPDGLGYDLVETLERLKLCSKPTTFWLSHWSNYEPHNEERPHRGHNELTMSPPL